MVCAPKCSASFECPLDTPLTSTAQPQCMLQTVDQASYCGLLCQADAQCPSGASCRKVGTQGLGLCIHPLSFADWARLSSRVKLAIGFPSSGASGSSNKGFQVAKAYSALQSLKRRYAISDGDADVLTVKEMLAAAATPLSLVDRERQVLTNFESMVKNALHSAPKTDLVSEVSTDLKFFGKNMASGLPGWEREAESVVWNVEHIDSYGAATGLLRGLIELGLIYLACGAVYKYQMHGARGLQLIPHVDFWMDYPNLVADGVQYSKVLLSQMGGKAQGFESFPPASAERDTFANFEPSR
ncbi:unnamed protein product [Symbiodinium natans]|uniref:Uncharacterized protein n=1 Tax=Symbiodinium natans TaxID=878477 RepID=A0A812NRF3_9DINO|nr:unnamed protein product [Symbiodinium natans]